MPDNFSYGGQAVIEGVMMRGRKSIAIAVRKQDREIDLHREVLHTWGDRWPFLRWPLIRGSIALIDSLVIGVKALTYSASTYAEEEDEELGTKELVLTIGLAMLLTVGLFVALPAFIIRTVQSYIPANFVLNLIEGLIKISFFVLYILAISWLKDIQRVFQYHGAEHKVINCYEAGEELTVPNVRKYSTAHYRCGTNFLVIVLFTSVFLFSFFGRPPFIERVLIHLAILPLVAGISYEIIKKAGSSHSNKIIRAIAKPGLWLQVLTTREPDDDQIEVAIKALEGVLMDERKDSSSVRPLHVVS